MHRTHHFSWSGTFTKKKSSETNPAKIQPYDSLKQDNLFIVFFSILFLFRYWRFIPIYFMACRVIWWENLLKISESRRRIECWCVISIKNVEYLTWLLLVDVMEELAIALLVRCYCRHRTNSLFILMLMCFNSSYLNCSTIYLMFSWASYNSNDKRVFFFLLSYNCSHRIPYIGRLLHAPNFK